MLIFLVIYLDYSLCLHFPPMWSELYPPLHLPSFRKQLMSEEKPNMCNAASSWHQPLPMGTSS